MHPLGWNSLVVVVLLICALASNRCASAAPSVARVWDEQLLHAISIDTARPTVHARNLFHLSSAMYDAWAAYDTTAQQYVHQEKLTSANLETARNEAISYAAYNVILHRFVTGPAGVGPGRAATVVDIAKSNDGARFQPRLHLDRRQLARGIGQSYRSKRDPTRPRRRCERSQSVRDAGRSIRAGECTAYVRGSRHRNGGPQSLAAAPFQRQPDRPVWHADFGIDTAPSHAVLGRGHSVRDDRCRSQREWRLPRSRIAARIESTERGQVQRRCAHVDPPLVVPRPERRRNDGYLAGHARQYTELPRSPRATTKPATPSILSRAFPTQPELVRRGDFYRVVSEFWADGPRSTAPPGHWNEILHDVTDKMELLGVAKRLGGQGPVVSDLEWDVKSKFALNGGLHDAAIAAWNHKGVYDSSRPISFIRYMGQLGQSSDPGGPSYHPDGLPLEAGLVEVVTPASTAAGQRHAHLAGSEGKIAIRSWQGAVDGLAPFTDPSDLSGVDWILAENWMPYQLISFVTPPFAGYVSGPLNVQPHGR